MTIATQKTARQVRMLGDPRGQRLEPAHGEIDDEPQPVVRPLLIRQAVALFQACILKTRPRSHRRRHGLNLRLSQRPADPRLLDSREPRTAILHRFADSITLADAG